jgi:hypothetical protein
VAPGLNHHMMYHSTFSVLTISWPCCLQARGGDRLHECGLSLLLPCPFIRYVSFFTNVYKLLPASWASCLQTC